MDTGLRAGIIGAGFMGRVHAHAVRVAGGTVARIAASSAMSADRAAAALGAERAAASPEELIGAPDVDVVHICTPNATHVPLAEAALAAGKHVVCEKPLAVEAGQARDLATAAARSERLAAVPFVYRYYPSVREARSLIAAGEAGTLRLLHGAYLQDWQFGGAGPGWRGEAEHGGAVRTFGDVGVHWCDLMEFVTGHRVEWLLARVSEPGGETLLMFTTDGGAAGSAVISQAAAGRKNQLSFSFDGTAAAYCFDQQSPETLWVGGREENRVVFRGEAGESAGAARLSRLPPGHPQGYQDCFDAFVSDAYRAAARGRREDGMPDFGDGARAAVITDAVARSMHTEGWERVT